MGLAEEDGGEVWLGGAAPALEAWSDGTVPTLVLWVTSFGAPRGRRYVLGDRTLSALAELADDAFRTALARGRRHPARLVVQSADQAAAVQRLALPCPAEVQSESLFQDYAQEELLQAPLADQMADCFLAGGKVPRRLAQRFFDAIRPFFARREWRLAPARLMAFETPQHPDAVVWVGSSGVLGTGWTMLPSLDAYRASLRGERTASTLDCHRQSIPWLSSSRVLEVRQQGFDVDLRAYPRLSRRDARGIEVGLEVADLAAAIALSQLLGRWAETGYARGSFRDESGATLRCPHPWATPSDVFEASAETSPTVVAGTG